MGRELRIKIWGTRGSFPAAVQNRMEYGGNTLCISAELSDRILVMDAGSGLACLGEWIRKTGKPQRIDLFLSHLHLDHIMGLLKFAPFFDKEMEIHLYGETRDGHSLREMLERFISPPWWPVGFPDFQARLYFHEVKAGERMQISDELAYSSFRANHPNLGLLYRFELGEKSLLYGLDCEMDESIWEALAAFSKNCDLLICDGQYDAEELKTKKGWGHSSWEQAVKLRKAAKAGMVLITHHAWESTDDILRVREKAARETDAHCLFAREGLEVVV